MSPTNTSMTHFHIVLPSFGNPNLLQRALTSITTIDYPHFDVLIADDCSPQDSISVITRWIDQNPDISVNFLQNHRNLGLFRNLNNCITSFDLNGWIVLLCADDELYPSSLETLSSIITNQPHVNLILSAFTSSQSSNLLQSSSYKHLSQISSTSTTLSRDVLQNSLVKHGSINGNLTGMAFTTDLFHQANFKSDWTHAADWLWLVNVSRFCNCYLSLDPIASVHSHKQQLSITNRRSGNEVIEVCSVVQIMLGNNFSSLSRLTKIAYASHILQHQLWNNLKFNSFRSNRQLFLLHMNALRSVLPLPLIFAALFLSVPLRAKLFLSRRRP